MHKNTALKILSNLFYLFSIFMLSFLSRKFKNIPEKHSNEIIIIASFSLVIYGKLLYLKKEFSYSYFILNIKNKKRNLYTKSQILFYKLIFFTSTIIFFNYFHKFSALKIGIYKQIKVFVIILVNYFSGKKISLKEFSGVSLIITGVLLNTFYKSKENNETNTFFDSLMIILSVTVSALNSCYFDKKIKQKIHCFYEYFVDFNIYYFMIALFYQFLVSLYRKTFDLSGFVNFKVYLLGIIGSINVITAYANNVWFFALDRLLIYVIFSVMCNFMADLFLKNLNYFVFFFYVLTVIGVLIYKKIFYN
ncbi:hypothetical protein TUBRATIS_002410 [Tubulinosema ratisbonensis]|uniref:Nucleotide-sugar transporter n=1 Tax=Tubulinosema ratisbonensis TaxID=291195 RepID=A0A437APZ4_9MICR|nr:hypothetical protein TUBRATIS_002410 [Tubulinosema ratisbonensis]